MHIIRTLFLVAALSSLAEARGSFYIESCNLGCSSGAGGNPISCAIVDVHQDASLEFRFTEPLDISSVDPQSLRMIKVQDGSSVPGSYELGPGGLSLSFRPRLTFDINGTPVYAFEANTTYQVFIGGSAQGDTGSLLRSTLGNTNLSRLQCTINTSLGLLGPLRIVCGTTPNSTGSGGLLGWAGGSSLSLADLTLSAFSLPPSEFGMFFVGTRSVDLPLGVGVRCVGGSLARLSPPDPTDVSGNAARPVDLLSLPPALGVVGAGSRFYFQYWYRDGVDSNLTNAIEVTAFP